MDTLHGEGRPERKIAGFWRRVGAFAIDLVLLGIAGMILGALLSIRWPAWAPMHG